MNASDRYAILTFRLADQYYALPIDNVLEVVAMMTVSTIPNSHEAVLGMVNRHGTALPMLDLRLAFQFDPSPPEESTLFIVAQDDLYLVGLVVDEILQVRYVDGSDVKVAHGTGRYISHIISTGQGLYQQVNLNALSDKYLKIIQS